VVSEVDSTLAVELNITQGDKSNSSYSHLKRSRQVQFPHVCKKANSFVDCLTNYGHSLEIGVAHFS
jgi:hypothetical protein